MYFPKLYERQRVVKYFSFQSLTGTCELSRDVSKFIEVLKKLILTPVVAPFVRFPVVLEVNAGLCVYSNSSIKCTSRREISFRDSVKSPVTFRVLAK